nr:Arm DNA-binding domain-containing protein [Hydrogenophaga sp.]
MSCKTLISIQFIEIRVPQDSGQTRCSSIETGEQLGEQTTLFGHSAKVVPPMLTDIACKSAVCPPSKARARLTDAGGLYLEISPSGSKRWFWKYYFSSKEKRLALGT